MWRLARAVIDGVFGGEKGVRGGLAQEWWGGGSGGKPTVMVAEPLALLRPIGSSPSS